MRNHRLLTASEVLALRRKLVGPAKLREIGQARERDEARLRSGWDSYEGAIRAAEGDPDHLVEHAHKSNTDRLVDCLRAHKPLADGDRDRLGAYIATKRRRRRWPRWLVDALSRTPTEDDYELLADLVAEVGRKPWRVADAPAHRAARLARVLLSLGPKRMDARLRTALIATACGIESDESGVKIDTERVRNLVDHPRARDTKR